MKYLLILIALVSMQAYAGPMEDLQAKALKSKISACEYAKAPDNTVSDTIFFRTQCRYMSNIHACLINSPPNAPESFCNRTFLADKDKIRSEVVQEMMLERAANK